MGKFVKILLFFMLFSLTFLSLIIEVSALEIAIPPAPIIGGVPVPEPYVPCDEVRKPEFHSLRPYQASPCNVNAEDLAIFCGNDFTILDPINISKVFTDGTGTLEWEYTFEGQPISPTNDQPVESIFYCSYCVGDNCIWKGDSPCIPDGCTNDADCEALCTDNGDGTETCIFTVERIKDIAIDLDGSYLPIMGFTEPSEGTTQPFKVVNSVYQGDETMDDPAKVNEYVSWYLNGIIGRAEYDQLDVSEEEDHLKITDFSGPSKKLLSFENQITDRINEVLKVDTGETRHNQVTGCVNSLGEPTHCYPDGSGINEIRLSYWEDKFPPLRADYEESEDYIEAYEEWKDNTYWELFDYIPFTSTEDRIGMVELSSYTVHPPISGTVTILYSEIIAQDPAELFFAHMEESLELSNIPREIFNPRGYND